MKKLLFLLTIFSIVISCSEDESNSAEILELTVNGLSNNDLLYEDSYVDAENKKVTIFLNNNLNEFIFPITIDANIKLSSGAKASSISGSNLIFNNPDDVLLIPVEAEDGTIKNWYLQLVHLQLQNSNFENWFDNKGVNGKTYEEIGNSLVTTVWSTANMGTSTYSVYNTKPLSIDNNTLVEIKTQVSGTLPITAGTIFTGLFSLADAIANPTDPEQATLFGTPFIFRPTGFKFKYKYQAGEEYIQATLINPENIFGGFNIESISGEDQCTAYAFLEIRDGDNITEIARTKMESGTTADELSETTLTFNYTSSENPTHLTIVFSSSTGGHLWTGAVGSTLVIDDLELIYD